MNQSAELLLVVYFAVLFALAWPLALWLHALLDGRLAARVGFMRVIESSLLRSMGSRVDDDMPWWRYASGLIVFNVLGVIAVYGIQRLQAFLPLNPALMSAVTSDSAFNTAISFVTNTNWQGYAGEATMSHLTQMLALTVQNFLSAATGIAVVTALIRGFVRQNAAGVGHVWLDLIRSTLWVLLPLSAVFAVVLVSQGTAQNFSAPVETQRLESVTYSVPAMDAGGKPVLDAAGKPTMRDETAKTQSISVGPVASQVAIKMIGTNGGGFFNANAAHPLENPTPLANFMQMISIFLIPAALVFLFGHMVADSRQAWAVLAAMTVMFVCLFAIVFWSESQANPLITALGVDGTAGNLEGKEVRFGVLASAFFATLTTAASCGAVNAMHGSFMPIGGGVVMWLMQLGEVVFGGVGAGLYGMLIFAILAVFLAGLMIGRTPEYLGKKIGAFEMKMVSIAILVTPLLVLGGTAISVLSETARGSILNPGAQGFSEILYAFSSAANNNGSAFAGLSANTPYYNTALAIAMWFGRFGVIIPVLAIAGALAAKPRLPAGPGTVPTHGPLFVVLLVATVFIVGALTYLPALALGPVVEHLQLFSTVR